MGWYKIKSWIKRYGPAEIYGTIGSMVFGYVGFQLTNSEIVGSYASVLGGDLGYYGYTITQEYLEQSALGDSGKKAWVATLKDTITEFGVGEVCDSLVIRPTLIYWSSQIFTSFPVALFVGNTVADVIFYIPTTYLYEITFIRDMNRRLQNLDINVRLRNVYYKIFGVRKK